MAKIEVRTVPIGFETKSNASYATLSFQTFFQDPEERTSR
jgi:hypothetical protein